ncbi:hypothetical protein B0A48_14906 [Cryoendolithus antarcticus]|uniref:Uncharacterized protein n=1 Tax=Cryoendolithus antarcticus TaxID=1507870 RepID=A0A1V8SIS4_9PEZI|nr:hypothetical protein B0A48_14906 [Cryoendolithus antarcticus]
MVQLVSRSRHDIDNVYKLGFEPGRSVYSLNRILQHLDDAGYYRPTQPSWTHAFQLVVRYQSGLLSYEKYGIAELRAFAAAREITRTCSVTRGLLEKTLKADLVPILEQADDERTFRLMDLPPELRNTIYVAYLASLPTMPMRLVQPPLCLASRQLRDETLKVFFSTCSFTLVFHVEGHRFRGRASETYGVSVDETIFQRHPPDCFNYMNRFEVNLLPRLRQAGDKPTSLGTWRVALDDTDGGAQSTLPPRVESTGQNRTTRDQIDELDGDFVASPGEWAKLVSQRQGPRKLGIGDIDTMRLALQEVVLDKRFPWLGFLPQWRRTRGGRGMGMGGAWRLPIMVHIKTRKGKCETYDEDEQSSYWMLGIGTRKSIYYVEDYKDYLDRHGYVYKRSLRKAQLFELTTRCQRGLLSYMKYDLEELVQFARARGLISGSATVAAKHRAKLEAALERADDNTTFHRLKDEKAAIRDGSGIVLSLSTLTIEHQRVALHTQRLLIRWSSSATKVRKRKRMFWEDVQIRTWQGDY